MKKATPYIITGVLCVLLLVAGMMYTRYNLKNASPSSDLKSTFIASGEASNVSKEKIEIRMSQIEQEIIQATNDPERALELRRELLKLKDQLSKLNQN